MKEFGKIFEFRSGGSSSLPLISRFALGLIRGTIKTIGKILHGKKWEDFLTSLGDFLFPDGTVTLPRTRYENLKREKWDLFKERDSLKSDLEKTKTEWEKLRENFQKLQGELEKKQQEITNLEKTRKTLSLEVEKWKTNIEEISREKENLRSEAKELEKKNQNLTERVQTLEKKLAENSLKNKINLILKDLLPRMEFLGESLEIIADHLERENGFPSALETLREIHFNGGAMKGQRVESAKGWKERHVGKALRLYFKFTSQGKIGVLLSFKNNQRQDIEYLKQSG